MAESFTRVNPGDLITAELMNRVLDKLESLDASVTNLLGRVGSDFAALQLGDLARDTHTLVALATGFEPGGGIWLDGKPLLSGEPGRGINLLILDADLNIKHRQTYDTWGSVGQAEQLAADLNARASHSDVVIGMTHDAYTERLTANAKAALAAIGAAGLGEATQDRDNAAFIGVVPASQTGVGFNYLVSVIPADGPGTGSARLAALPFAWGLYSRPLRRFLLGGTCTHQPLPSIPTLPTSPTLTFTFTTPTFTIPTLTQTTPTLTFTFTTPTFTIPTLTQTTPTLTFTFTFTPTFTSPIDPTLTLTPTLSIRAPAGSPPAGPPIFTASLPTNVLLPGGSVPAGDLGLESPEQPVSVVRGVGPQRLALLNDAGIQTIGDLADTSVERLMATGVSENVATTLIAEARNLIGRR